MPEQRTHQTASRRRHRTQHLVFTRRARSPRYRVVGTWRGSIATGNIAPAGAGKPMIPGAGDKWFRFGWRYRHRRRGNRRRYPLAFHHPRPPRGGGDEPVKVGVGDIAIRRPPYRSTGARYRQRIVRRSGWRPARSPTSATAPSRHPGRSTTNFEPGSCRYLALLLPGRASSSGACRGRL